MAAKPRKRVRRELDLKQKVLLIRDASDNPKPTQKLKTTFENSCKFEQINMGVVQEG